MSTVDHHERGRDFITESEFEILFAAARSSRNPERNQAILMLMYRHGLRCSEVCGLLLSDVELSSSRMWIRRLKGGLSTHHPIAGDELRVLRRYLKKRLNGLPWLFLSEQQNQINRGTVYALVQAISQKSSIGVIHPHMLRHGCGYYLSNRGYDLRLIQDYLGHRDPKHTARYTRTAAGRFEGLWDN